MTKEEWISFYEKKSGDKYDELPGFFICFDEQKGFCQYNTRSLKNILVICHCAGDGNYWQDLAKKIARKHKKKWLMTTLKRNPLAYCRARRWAITEIEEHGPDKYLRIRAVNKEGKQVILTQQGFTRNTGKPVFYVTEEV